jgi:hypothetical protein
MTATIIFIAGALVINGLIYAGMYAVYAADQRRVDPARVPEDGSQHALGVAPRPKEAAVAASDAARHAA